MKVWSATDGRPLGVLRGHAGPVGCVQLCRPHVVSGSMDCTVRIWSLATNAAVAVLRGHRGPVHCVHTHAAVVLSGSADASIRLWSLPTGDPIAVLVVDVPRSNPVAPFTAAASAPPGPAVVCVQSDGRVVVAGLADGSVAVWPFAAATSSTVAAPHPARHRRAGAADRGGSLAPPSPAPVAPLYALRSHRAGVWELRLLDDGCSLLSAAFDQRLLLWDFACRAGDDEVDVEPEGRGCLSAGGGGR
ncbi:hypothetical protein HK405_014573 [Cladochytrium tenue]|nr:hypothetical protein HK405_014573 [Cladochytrium tenue]